MSRRRTSLYTRAAASPFCALLIICVALCAAKARPQEGKENQKGQDEAIRLKAHLVTIDITVKDKKGRSITDLVAEDFTVYENGVRQRVEFFEPPLVRDKQTVTPSSTPSSGAQGEPISSGGAPMNIISLVVDGTTTGLADMAHVRKGLIKYISEQVGDTDTVALFAVTGGLRLLQPFTHDKSKLISAVEKSYASTTSSKNLERDEIASEIGKLQNELSGLSGSTEPQAQLRAMMARRALERFTLLRGQLSLQTARPILAALAAICDAQRAIPGKKTLVLFSQGVVTTATLDWQVQSTIDIANRANVAIYIIDSAGLTASAPQSGALVPSSPFGGIAASGSSEDRIRAVGGENVFDNARHEGINREHDNLYRISVDTGGEFIKGSNDIAKGLSRIDQEIRSRYTLAYYSSDQNFDGSFRKVKVEVRRPDARVTSRPGYHATAGDEIVPLSAEDKRLLANFATAQARPAFPISLVLSPFRVEEGRYKVPLSIEVPPEAVKFDQKGDKQLLQLEVLGVIRETPAKIINRLGGNFNIVLTAEQYKSILTNNIFYRQDIELAAGDYDIELIIKDRQSGKMAARKEKLSLPAADTEFATSGLVLSRHVEQAPKLPVSVALAGAGDLLSHEGVLIRPLPSREFRAGDNLIIFFKVYNAAASPETGKPKVKVTVTLMKDGKAAIKPIDYLLTEGQSEPVPHLTVAKFISLDGLPAGKYAAAIESRDMVAGKRVTQEASFVIKQ
ncbi:MAG TPA: VWA domain-containing protein [Blastocatellia bacterium]|nr:VWA domain-containing protein [Blastocatellia bacterium]